MLTTQVQNVFNAGEWSPRLFGRVDLQKYDNALASMVNAIAYPHGGAYRRSGTRFVHEVKDSTKATRLVEFEFNADQTYVLEFSDLCIRFYKDGGIITTAPNTPYEVVSPWPSTALSELKYVQSADVLYLLHPDYKPYTLSRTTDTNWTLAAFDFIDGPYLATNTTATTLKCSANTGSGLTMTASASLFASTDVGRLVRLKFTNWGYAKITAYTSATVVTVTVVEALDAATPGTTTTTTWRLGAWSNTTGWPQVAAFHQLRLWMACTNTQPQTLWGSVTSDFTNFQPSNAGGTVADDDSPVYTIDDDQVNAVSAMKSDARGMVILTRGGPFLMRAPSGEFNSITPTAIGVRKHNAEGANSICRVHMAGDSLLVPDIIGKRIYEQAYSFDRDRFKANDMTLLSEHITTGSIIDTALQTTPIKVLWCVMNDGKLIGMTYERDNEVVAWHNHTIGGTDVEVESVAISRETTGDQVWLVVKRTIDGGTVRYVEYIEDRFDINDDQEDAFFVDCGLSYDSTPATTISGLDHLEGESVAILADGAAHPNKTVTGGEIELDRSSSVVHIGLPQTMTVRTMPVFIDKLGNSDSRGKFKQLYKVFIQFHRTLGGEINTIADSELGDSEEIQFRTGSDNMDEVVSLFTGLEEVSLPTSSARMVQVIYENSQPFPVELLSLGMEFNGGGV